MTMTSSRRKRWGLIALIVAAVIGLSLLAGLGRQSSGFDAEIDMTSTVCHNAHHIFHDNLVWNSHTIVPKDWLGQSISGRMETTGNTAIFTAADGTEISYTTTGPFSDLTCKVNN